VFYVSEIKKTAPAVYRTALQQKVYQTLDALQIPYQRVDTDEAITMADCVAIDEKLKMEMVKTLFLTNRQKTAYWLFITAGDKPFRAKDFASALDCPRPSFAPAEAMASMLGTQIGAVTIFSALLPSADGVQIVVDRDVADADWYGCSDGTTTGYMKLKTEDVLDTFLPAAGRRAVIAAV
jgi:Ala-tRNA(Pro) deacylase